MTIEQINDTINKIDTLLQKYLYEVDPRTIEKWNYVKDQIRAKILMSINDNFHE